MNELDYRPYPAPATPWVMAQIWHDLLFAHWAMPFDELRRAVPAALPLDTFDGQAWIGVLPFRMTGVRPKFVPSIPWLSAFPELNVRTYVTIAHKPGVYFFSLDAANPLAVQVARRAFSLPYFNARMSCERDGDGISYSSNRTHRGAAPAEFIARYRPTGDVFQAARGSLEYWLTARYCLYTADTRGRVSRAEIDHAPWSLQSADAKIEINTMTQPHGIHLPSLPPLLHFARRLDVVVWLPIRISSETRIVR